MLLRNPNISEINATWPKKLLHIFRAEYCCEIMIKPWMTLQHGKTIKSTQIIGYDPLISSPNDCLDKPPIKLRHKWWITFRKILWYVITYQCPNISVDIRGPWLLAAEISPTHNMCEVCSSFSWCVLKDISWQWCKRQPLQLVAKMMWLLDSLAPSRLRTTRVTTTTWCTVHGIYKYRKARCVWCISIRGHNLTQEQILCCFVLILYKQFSVYLPI